MICSRQNTQPKCRTKTKTTDRSCQRSPRRTGFPAMSCTTASAKPGTLLCALSKSLIPGAIVVANSPDSFGRSLFRPLWVTLFKQFSRRSHRVDRSINSFSAGKASSANDRNSCRPQKHDLLSTGRESSHVDRQKKYALNESGRSALI